MAKKPIPAPKPLFDKPIKRTPSATAIKNEYSKEFRKEIKLIFTDVRELKNNKPIKIFFVVCEQGFYYKFRNQMFKIECIALLGTINPNLGVRVWWGSV